MGGSPGQAAADGNWLSGGQMSGVSWFPVAGQMHDHVMAVTGLPASRYYWEPETFVDAFTDVGTYYDLDIIMPEADVYNFEIEALGGKMIYGENAMPTVDFREPLIKQPEDLARLKTPDFHQDGRLPFALEYMKLRKERFPALPMGGIFCAIFSLAVGLRGYPALIKDMRRRPDFVHELFTFIVDEVLVPYLRTQRDYCRVNTSHGADAWACVPNLSIDEMRTWLVPYNQRLEQKAAEFGMRVTSGTGDYCEEDLSKFDVGILNGSWDIQLLCRGGTALSLGMGKWHEYPLGPVRDYTEGLRASGKTISILAGINARLLRDGPVDRIVDTVKRFVDTLGRDHPLTFWLSNVPADTSADHVHAAVAAVHAYGRLPVAENLDDIKLELPARESFKEWQSRRTSGPG